MTCKGEALLLLALSGCASLSPRFSQSVAASFARQPMRKLTTESLELYYPESERAVALRVAARLEGCVERLRKLPLSPTARPRAVIFLTDSVFNNAYVQSEAFGTPQQMLLPNHMTLEVFNWLELGVSEIEDISCHESVHYVHLQQTDGFFDVLNDITGGIWQPNIFTESWFLEGLATFYEGRLDKEVGRPHSMFWRGLLDSGLAATPGGLGAGDLNASNRTETPFGGNYLVGQRFVEYLANTYGEQKLWELIDIQGRSILSPLGVTLRFKAVYGRSIGALFDDFMAAATSAKPRTRPPSQRVVVPDAGYLARLASSRFDGALALLSGGRDEPSQLSVLEADGRVRFTERVTPLIPPRPWIESGPEAVSGLSFSSDGRWLYWVTADVAEDGAFTSQVLRADAHTGETEVAISGLNGFGGTVSPAGREYAFVELEHDTANLVALDLATGERRPLTALTGRTSLGAPAWSPDGRIAFSRWTGEGWELLLRERDGTVHPVGAARTFQYGAQWLDSEHVLDLGAVDGRWQVQVVTLSTGAAQTLTDAPYVALDPVITGDHVAFLNRDGWGWTVDEVALPAIAEGAAPGVDEPIESETLQPPALINILRDEPYSKLDHLGIPTLRAPYFFVLPVQDAVTNATYADYFAGAALVGADRLGFHNYALSVSYESSGRNLDLAATYGNYLLAPWFSEIGWSRFSDTVNIDSDVWLDFSRSFWTSPVDIGVRALNRRAISGFDAGAHYFLAGGTVSAAYFAGDGTPYAGTQRGIGGQVMATYYPRALGSTLDVFDGRAELDVYVPLPGPRRHSLSLSLVGRDLPGAPQGLLRVGGNVPGIVLASAGDPTSPTDFSPVNLPFGLEFVESLRGYEDYALRGTRAAVASAQYRWPLILDKGTASIVYIGPSFFLSQIDFEAFGTAAATDVNRATWHRAVGAEISAHSQIGQLIPLTLFVQGARRFDDGLDWLVFTGFALQ